MVVDFKGAPPTHVLKKMKQDNDRAPHPKKGNWKQPLEFERYIWVTSSPPTPDSAGAPGSPPASPAQAGSSGTRALDESSRNESRPVEPPPPPPPPRPGPAKTGQSCLAL